MAEYDDLPELVCIEEEGPRRCYHSLPTNRKERREMDRKWEEERYEAWRALPWRIRFELHREGSLLLQWANVPVEKQHAFTTFKQTKLPIAQIRLRERSNVQKRQLYGAPV